MDLHIFRHLLILHSKVSNCHFLNRLLESESIVLIINVVHVLSDFRVFLWIFICRMIHEFCRVENAANGDCNFNKYMDGNVCRGIFKNNRKQSRNEDTVISFLFSSRKEISI